MFIIWNDVLIMRSRTLYQRARTMKICLIFLYVFHIRHRKLISSESANERSPSHSTSDSSGGSISHGLGRWSLLLNPSFTPCLVSLEFRLTFRRALLSSGHRAVLFWAIQCPHLPAVMTWQSHVTDGGDVSASSLCADWSEEEPPVSWLLLQECRPES